MDETGGTAAERLLEPGVLDRLRAHLEARAAMLRRHGHEGFDLADGLSDREIGAIEDRWGFVFPPDLRAVLGAFVPVGGPWVDWRSADSVKERLDWPADGIASDVVESGLWLAEWGERPSVDQDAVAIARRAIVEAPALIPLWSHRYLVADPPAVGNPVLSVYQADIVFYGDNLADWFHRDHGFEEPVPSDGPDRDLGLWGRFLFDDDLW
ncbi:MAG: hypothetical protein ACTHN0_09125 [Aquihabitans sp.]